MAWDERNFDDRLSNLKRVWENAEKRGSPHSEERKVWSLISLELDFSDKPLSELGNIALHARRWIETKNPHHIDAAFLICRKHGIAPPPTLLRLMADVAATRFSGLEQAGTGKRIRDDAIQAQALQMICCLHIAGASVELAASKAARYIADAGLGKTYKASTLERVYAKKFRNSDPSLESEMRSAMERAPEAWRQTWARLLHELPEADDDLKGNRRA